MATTMQLLDAPISTTSEHPTRHPRRARLGRAVVGVTDDLDAISGALVGLGLDVRGCDAGSQAKALVYALQPDLVVLDVRHPDMDGLEICRQLRQEPTDTRISEVPIILVAGDIDEVDAIIGLEIGADDVIRKPFGARLLQARAKALLRRASFTGPTVVRPRYLSSGDLTVDLVGRQVMRGGQPLHVTPRELDLLTLFVSHPGQVFSRDEIYARVWRDRAPRESHTLSVHLFWLRSKIEPDPAQPIRLQTVSGHGYIFHG